MDMLTTDISSLGYKAVKEKVDKIDVNEVHNSEDLIKIIDILKADKRKNINSLGNKLQRAKDKIESEIKRVREMYNFDKSFGDFQVVAGVDEVGRGPLAGPIVSCAVVLDLNVLDDELILWINDSKKINEKKREELAEIIKEKAVAVYKAIFVKDYTSYDYRCFVGNCEFNAETKTFLLRLVSLLSKYSKYE